MKAWQIAAESVVVILDGPLDTGSAQNVDDLGFRCWWMGRRSYESVVVSGVAPFALGNAAFVCRSIRVTASSASFALEVGPFVFRSWNFRLSCQRCGEGGRVSMP